MIVLFFFSFFFYSKGSVKEMLNLSQQDYVKRIEELNQVMLWTTLMQTKPQQLFYWRVDPQHPLLYYTVHLPSFWCCLPALKVYFDPFFKSLLDLNFSCQIFRPVFLIWICMVCFMLRHVIGKMKSNDLFDVLIYSKS